MDKFVLSFITNLCSEKKKLLIRCAFARADQHILCPNINPEYKLDSNSCCFCLKKSSFQLAEQDNLKLTIVQLEESRNLNRKVTGSIFTRGAVLLKNC